MGKRKPNIFLSLGIIFVAFVIVAGFVFVTKQGHWKFDPRALSSSIVYGQADVNADFNTTVYSANFSANNLVRHLALVANPDLFPSWSEGKSWEDYYQTFSAIDPEYIELVLLSDGGNPSLSSMDLLCPSKEKCN